MRGLKMYKSLQEKNTCNFFNKIVDTECQNKPQVNIV